LLRTILCQQNSTSQPLNLPFQLGAQYLPCKRRKCGFSRTEVSAFQLRFAQQQQTAHHQ
jgi:hypothetical protein